MSVYMCVCKGSAVRALIPAVRQRPTWDHSFTEQALLTGPLLCVVCLYQASSQPS